MIEMDKSMSLAQAANQISHNFLTIMIGSIIMHLVFGITLGLVSSGLIHGTKPIEQKKILILGGGFAGVQVLRKVQDAFQNDVSVDISLVSRDNFFLFTPSFQRSGMIDGGCHLSM